MLQQGYPSSEVTILTPYLGQLRLIRRELGKLGTLVCLDDRDAAELAELEEQEAAAAAARDRNSEGPRPAGTGDAGAGGSNRDGAAAAAAAAAAVPEPASPLAANGGSATARRMAVGEAVRLATIDNFQGEESTIVIISLVRSNRSNDIGFLRRQNRVNVLLSRAKHGMYLVGNPACLAGGRNTDSMWARILPDLEAQGLVGTSLPLCCQKHPDTITPVMRGRDFDDLVSEGGCRQSCGERMSCGHACPRLCHPDDPDHTFTRAACMEPCLQIHERCGHHCLLRCSQPCGECRRPIAEVELPCGHIARNVACYRAQRPADIPCSQEVQVTMPHCGHVITVPCGRRKSVESAPWECTASCGGQLPCGHPCPSTCGRCFSRSAEQALGLSKPLAQQTVQLSPDGRQLSVGAGKNPKTLSPLPSADQLQHSACHERCSRTLFCGHTCSSGCHAGKPCPPCTKPCALRCTHSKCGKACHEFCAPCAHKCSWQCTHQGPCNLPCAAPCMRLPCDRRCECSLPCGHRCPSVCGERCPSRRFCIECGDPQLMVSDLLMAEELPLRELTQEQVDEEPLVVLPCGHAFLMGGLDEHLELEWRERSALEGEGGGMELRGCYVRGADGAWLEPAPLQERMGPARTCSLCRAPLAMGQLMRYGRPLNKQLLGGAQRKFLAATSAGQQSLDASLAELQAKVEAAAGRTTRTTGAQAAAPGVLTRGELAALLRHAQSLRQQYCRLGVEATNGNPGMRVHRAARASLLRQADEEGRDGSEVDAQLATLVMPHPDITQWCFAFLGQARACLQVVQVAGMEVQVCAALHGAGRGGAAGVDLVPMARNGGRVLAVLAVPRAGRGGRGGRAGGHGRGAAGPHPAHLSPDAARSWMCTAVREGQSSLQQGLFLAGKVQQLAGEHQALRTQANAALVQAQLLVGRVALLSQVQLSAVRQLLGPDGLPGGSQEAASGSAAAAAAVEEAEAACHTGLQLLGRLQEGSEPALHSALRQLLDRLATFKREMMSEEEMRSVLRALVAATPSLANQGWGGQGHFFECPNGHPYIITECGGMQQAATCPECNAPIGGTSYRLAERNRPSDLLRNLALQRL